MSYERAESFVEDTEADATTIESEFNNIADWLTGLFQTGRVTASADLTLTKNPVDVPGASTTLVVPQASKLLVWAVFDFEVLDSHDPLAVGYLYVDSVAQVPAAVFQGKEDGERAAVSQNYCLTLAPGNRTIKLRADADGEGTSKSFQNHTGFTYLLIPEP